MPKDYKHRVPGYRQARRRGKRGWLAAGIVVVCLAAGAGTYVILSRQAETATVNPTPEAPPQPAPAVPTGTGTEARRLETPAPTAVKKATPPRFTFYKILSEKEEIIPEAEIRTIKREEEQGRSPPGGGYIVQAGSYRSRPDAEKMRAELAKLKVKARLERVKIENVEWFRVKIGPYENLAEADRLRTILKKNGIDSVVQKMTPRQSPAPAAKH
ncbi:SPOR domain-containing protein [Methylococcus capsulatus]|uniref:SPOR domain-containing protein n=1 Tax=Methylococcus capsulatus TaxID=414 RepID=UPI001C532E3C|nr:SPOR domain-containing protein [Methylococcus capsulatus]QXP86510.1 SPOR domain-containing protein [Methylococcus capsulatus]UQN11457.1 SPOR domain-containing protein [Methylococcus capsulatus]